MLKEVNLINSRQKKKFQKILGEEKIKPLKESKFDMSQALLKTNNDI